MSTITATPHYLTVSEAAQRLRCSKSFVYKLAERRELAHFAIGRRLLFDPAELDRFVATRRREVE